MAQLLIVNDVTPNATAQALNKFISSAVKLPREHARTERVGDLTLGVISGDNAPIFKAEMTGDHCWILGRPDLEPQAMQDYASQVLALYKSEGLQSVASLTGYFVCIIQTSDSTHIFTDLLGLFPIYWNALSQELAAGTSAHAVGYASSDQLALDPFGVVGHLAFMHEVGNQSLYQGVRRLPAGGVLTCRGSDISVNQVARLPIGTEFFDTPFEQHITLMSDAMTKATKEYDGDEIPTLFSGGLDSRLVAGYLHRQFGQSVTAYTFGDTSDTEYKCARKITRHLGWDHVRMEINYKNYRTYAGYQLDLDQAANGFNDLAWWEFSQQQEACGRYMPTGFLGDSTMGGSHIPWGYSEEDQSYSFAPLLQHALEWGIGEANLKRILHPDVFNEVYPKVLETLENSYHALPGEPFQKVWQFDLMNRQRYHVAGSVRRMQNMSWPTFPMAHYQVLHAAGNMPCSTLLHRKLQREMLKQLFPELAKFPLDNFTHFPEVLLPTRAHTLLTKIKRRVHRFNPMRKLKETRYYYRTYDINNDGWRNVRTLVNTDLQNSADLFKTDEVQKLLRQPGDKITAKNGVKDVAGLKTLLSIVLLGQRCATPEGDQNPVNINSET